MILYVNGDSHSAGAELTNPAVNWPALLADRMGYRLINDAVSGASNSRILRTASDFSTQANPADTFIIIGWSSWEREEWSMNGRYYNVNAGGHDSMPPELELRYKTWVAEQSPDTMSAKSKITHQQLYRFHRGLKERRIPHLFFNAFMPFQHRHPVSSRPEWNNRYLGPYDNDLSYFWYLKNQGFKHSSYYHFNNDAQPVWAEVLHKFILENKLHDTFY